MTPTTAGVIVTDGKNLLLCHVTGQAHWDLPKGKIDPGETCIAAAVRELYEETNLQIHKDDLIELGVFPYKKKKPLSLWLYSVKAMPDTTKLFCHSIFNDSKGLAKTEMDDYQIVKWNKIKKLVVPSMYKTLLAVKKTIKLD